MTKMRSVVRSAAALVLACMLLAWPLAAATPTAKPEEVGFSSERLQRVTDLIQRHISAGNISGAVTLVARHGRIARFEAQGLMDIESKTPMRKDTIFSIMSMTKPVVAASILMMVEEGRVRLTDPVSRFIPELKQLTAAVPQAGGTPASPTAFATAPADREITIRDLLTHVSGLLSGPIGNAEIRKIPLTRKENLAEYIPRLGQIPLEFQPGTRWAYSPTAGFDVLARIVEVTSGQPFDQFTRQRIFSPLGMKDTFFYPVTGNPRIVTNYEKLPSGLKKQDYPWFMNGVYFSGGGGLMSTAEDYLQFAQMLLNGGQLDGRRILAPGAVERMSAVVTPDTLPGRSRGQGYGLGVRVVSDPVEANTFLSKGTYGWSGAFGTHFWIDPKEKVVAILMMQTPNNELQRDFENAVMLSLVGSGTLSGTN